MKVELTQRQLDILWSALHNQIEDIKDSETDIQK